MGCHAVGDRRHDHEQQLHGACERGFVTAAHVSLYFIHSGLSNSVSGLHVNCPLTDESLSALSLRLSCMRIRELEELEELEMRQDALPTKRDRRRDSLSVCVMGAWSDLWHMGALSRSSYVEEFLHPTPTAALSRGIQL